MREFALRLIEDPDTLREQIEQQVRAERESKPWLRDAREAASTRERLAKPEIVAERYRDQQAEGLITMVKLPEKLDEIRPLSEKELAERRRAAAVERCARFRELYGMLGLRAAVHTDGTLDVTVGATGQSTKGVMPWNGSDSPSTISTRT